MRKLAECVLAVALLAAGAAGDDLDKQLLDVDRRFANQLAALALKAERQKQAAAARCLYGRALELQADQPAARKALGYTRRGGAWERSAAASADVESREDTDPVRVGALRAERGKIEELRAKEVMRILQKCDVPDRKRAILLALLRHVPRLEAVHAALDHEMIGDRRVRPELAALARALPERLAAWETCREPDSPSEAGAAAIAGVVGAVPSFRVGGRQVASVFGKDETARLASGTSCALKMVRLTLGEDAAVWDPSPVYFLSEKQFVAFVHARHESEAEREQRLRAALYVGADCTALAARDVNGALDLYAHCVGFHTVRLLAKAKPGIEECSWLMEGHGLVLSLELFDSAQTWFVSGGESAGKSRSTLPLQEMSRDACLAHVRDRLYDGSLPPLREILGSSLNTLDKARALQAWTFVRFLALYDPEAFRKLPGALRGRSEESKVGRSEGALQDAFGIDAARLDSLWQAYLLELA